ncbi:MAG: bifunctional diguanylate cyclase/phosphodiesterase [Mariprofundales bacterium]|nr:bifunctional diguanylate cyclase/phosphodiesterase [Mariprofundales bacterium]
MNKFLKKTDPQENQPTPAQDGINTRKELMGIIENEAITPLFQPIVDIKHNHIFGYETLSRGPRTSPLHMPEAMFAAAREHGLLFELDCLCRRKAIARFQQLALKGKLFINLDPNSLFDPDHQQGATLDILERYHLPCNQVVIELTEHDPVSDMNALKRAAAHYRAMGFAIAMDDLSAGYSNLQLMAELRPEFIKLDKYFVSKLAHDNVAREFMRAICKLARSVKCAVIAEGVESAIDLKEVRKLKSRYAQGFFLGSPETIPATELPDGMVGSKTPEPISATDDLTPGNETSTAETLCCHIIPSDPSDHAITILNRFQQDDMLLAIPIVREQAVLGLCERNATLQRFAMRYGHELYGNKPISMIMNKTPLIAATNTPMEKLSQMVTARLQQQLYDPIVMVENGLYQGLAYIHDLLEHITELSLNRAMECNPLTRLPGNIAIERDVNQRLSDSHPFILCYIDLDNFKAFNDRYGYERGDVMIRLLADLLREWQQEGDFVGHIGGDDFILIIKQRSGWEQQVEQLMAQFVTQAHELYDSDDVAKGHITAEDREGKVRTFPLASLSIGAVPCPAGRYASHLETAEVAVMLKHKAKQQIGNRLEIDRRTHTLATAPTKPGTKKTDSASKGVANQHSANPQIPECHIGDTLAC